MEFSKTDRDRLISFAIRRKWSLITTAGLSKRDISPDCEVAADVAIRSYDPAKGSISNWIILHVSRAIIDSVSAHVGISQHVMVNLFKFMSARHASHEVEGTMLDDDELMKMAGLPTKSLRSIRLADGMLRARRDYRDGDLPGEFDLEDECWNSWLIQTVLDVIEQMRASGRLTQRHFDVLERRFLHGMTLEETGLSLGVTREGVRLSEITALKRVRNHPTIASIGREHFWPSTRQEMTP